MAVTIQSNLTELFDGQTLTGWTGGTAVAAPEAVIPRYLSASIAFSLGIASGYYYRTYTAFSMENTNLYWWAYANVPNTYANGGYQLILGDGTNRRSYFVGGSDRRGHTFGAWSCLMLDTRNLPLNYVQNAGAAAPNLAAITQVGVGFNHLGKNAGNVPTVYLDVGRYGPGLTAIGGTVGSPGNISEIRTEDANTANAYGIVRELVPGIYGLQGSLVIGDGTGITSSYYEDSNVTVFFESNGAGNDAYEYKVLGNSTGTNSFVLGEPLGTGEDLIGLNGITLQSGGPHINVNFQGTNVNTLNIFGSQLRGIGPKDISLGTVTTHNFVSNIVSGSGRIRGNQVFMRNNFFIDTDGSAGLLWNKDIDIKRSSFIANSNAIQHDSSDGDPFTYDGLLFSANTYDILNTSGYPITINAITGSNPVTYNPGGDLVTIALTVVLTLTNLPNNTLVTIVKISNREVLFQENTGASSVSTYSYGADEVGVEVDILFMNVNYVPNIGNIFDFTLSAENTTLPISLIIDRTYIE